AQTHATSGHTHIALVVEESKLGDRVPEEFVADLVIRVGRPVRGGYTRRTVEIVKARGQGHIRGEHSLAIRGDDPVNDDSSDDRRTAYPDDPRTRNRYIQVYPSLNYLSRECERPQIGPHPRGFAAFGIDTLDEMLHRLPRNLKADEGF